MGGSLKKCWRNKVTGIEAKKRDWMMLRLYLCSNFLGKNRGRIHTLFMSLFCLDNGVHLLALFAWCWNSALRTVELRPSRPPALEMCGLPAPGLSHIGDSTSQYEDSPYSVVLGGEDERILWQLFRRFSALAAPTNRLPTAQYMEQRICCLAKSTEPEFCIWLCF